MANIKLTAREDKFVASMNNAAGAAGRLAAMVNVQLVRSMREADYVTNNFRQGLGKLGDKTSSVGQNLSTYITAPLTLLSGVAAKAYGDIDQLKRGLDVYGTSLESIKQTAKLPGLGLEEAGQATIKFLSVKYAVDLSNKAVREFGNALVYSGRGKEELSGIATAFAQIKGKGAVMAQEINQIAERLPMIRDLMQQAFGTSDTEKLQKMGIGADEFLAKIIAQMEKLPRVSGGFKVGWENIIDSVKIGAYEFFNAADKLFGLTEKLNALSGWIDNLVANFKTLSPETQKMIMIAGGLAAAIGPILVAIGGIITISGPAIAAISAISVPMLAIAAVAISVASTIIRNWDKIKKVLENSIVWKGIGAVAKIGLEYLGDIFGIFINFLTGDWEGLWTNLKNIVKRTWNLIIDAIAYGIKTTILLHKKLFELLGLDTLANGAGSAIQFVDSFLGKIKADAPVATNLLNKLADAFNKINTNTNTGNKITATDNKYDGLKGEKINILKIGKSETLNYFLEFGQTVEQATNNLQSKLNQLGKQVKFKAPEFLTSLDIFRNELNLKINETIAGAAETFGYALGSGGGLTNALRAGFAYILSAIGQYMIDLGKKFILAQELLKTAKVLFGTPTGWAAALALVAGGATIKGIASNYVAPRLASGGIAMGPTYAMVGEYSNARNNPEVIAPLSKLKNLIGGGMGDRQLVATIELDKLKIALDRVDRNTFGLL